MIQVIPAIDIIGGKCVRLTQGDFAQKKEYAQDPVELAKRLEGDGFKALHLVDLDGAKNGAVVNWAVLEAITHHTTLRVDFGGGIKTEAELKRALDAGARQVTLGSIAVRQPELARAWLHTYGAESLILGADVRDEKIAVNGWLETTELSLTDFVADYVQHGVRYMLCTDISRDGMLAGSAVGLYTQLQQQFPQLNIIASGGVTHISELEALQTAGVYGAVIGKALFEGYITVQDLKPYLN